MPPTLLKVCVLGSSTVGKTALIHQFAYHQFDQQNEQTDLQQQQQQQQQQQISQQHQSRISASTPTNNDPNRVDIIHCCCTFNGNVYHFKMIDMPAIKEFPTTSLDEWTSYQRTEIRSAHAYIFVFDLNQPSTFYYVKVIRDQLFESRNMQNVPVWVVGNKADLCLNVLTSAHRHRHDHHLHHSTQQHLIHSYHHSLPHLLPGTSHGSGTSPYEDLTPSFKDLANLVRKQWKCSYLECSAKYNWRIVPIFREILKSLESSLQHPSEQPQLQQQQQQSAQHHQTSHTPPPPHQSTTSIPSTSHKEHQRSSVWDSQNHVFDRDRDRDRERQQSRTNACRIA